MSGRIGQGIFSLISQDVKSVISLGMNYYTGYNQSKLNSSNKFSNYAWGEDYHDILKSRLYKLLNWLKIEMPDINGIACVDTSPVMDKVWAQRAGLGWQGNIPSNNKRLWQLDIPWGIVCKY